MRGATSPAAAPRQAEGGVTGVGRPTIGCQSIRKKVGGARMWLLVDTTGQAQVVEANKHAVMRRTGLPARDLRILDPLLSYPSTVLTRERAIVINVEHVKAIITAQEVLLQNFRDPSVIPFVDKLQNGITRHHLAVKSQENRYGENTDWTKAYDAEVSPPKFSKNFPSKKFDTEGKEQSLDNRDGLKLLPFEFVALEACLESACTCLDNQARTLEKEAHPALDRLTSNISSLNLERVKQIKSRLVAMSGRVQKVRDELEHLLDDNDDMAEMYLTEKLQEQLESSSATSITEQDGVDDDANNDTDCDDRNAEILTEGNDSSMVYQNDSSALSRGSRRSMDSDCDLYRYDSKAFSRGKHWSYNSMRNTMTKRLDVEELEILLEAYFVQIDGTLNKLSTLREYVEDTEDYINIMLDDKQNIMLQTGVMLSTANLALSVFLTVTGIFGMNISIELYKDQARGTNRFLWTCGGGTIATVLLYVIAIAWYKHRRLMD